MQEKKGSNIRLDLDVWQDASKLANHNRIMGRGHPILAALCTDATRTYMDVLAILRKEGIDQSMVRDITLEAVRRFFADRKFKLV